MIKERFYRKLENYLGDIKSEFENISGERIKTLDLLGELISKTLKQQKYADLVFICTHNSRRSQLGQIWAETAARYFGLTGIRNFSGGIESTAFHPNAVAAIQRAGYLIENKAGSSENPHYLIKSGEYFPANLMYSKKYDDPHIPKENFFAIIVCSNADQACPNVQGASGRIFIPYDDPKTYDGSMQKNEKYDECCREIARDIFYVFRQTDDSNHLF